MITHIRYVLFTGIFICLSFLQNLYSGSDHYFKIRVVDEQTGRGIPLVQVRTQNWIRYYSDSNGLVAFYEPGLMDQDLYLYIESEGYEYPEDLLGNKGFVINAAKSDSIVIKMQRLNIAERLYRITGQGIYRDSYILGETTPLKYPLLNGKVLGQDSNLRTIYKNKIYWFWGDTFKPAYAWGNFSVSGAISDLPQNGGLNQDKGIDLNYIVDSTGFSKSMIKLAGKGFVWFDWVLVLTDDSDNEQMVAKYARVKGDFTNHERGIAVFDDQKEMFEKYIQVDAWLDDYHTCDHPFLARVGNQSHIYFTSEFNFSRVEPLLEKLSDPAAYEAYTCLAPGAKYNSENPFLDRDQSGKLIWGWKPNTDAVGLTRQIELLKAGKISAHEKWLYFQDMITGEALDLQRGSIYWNDYRQRWILLIQKNIGQVWYAEAETPTGPWVFAQKIASHNQFFYNPVQHNFFDRENGKIIYFEGTYTNSFSGYPVMVAKYEYNQLMYRLNLDDPGLFLPQPVYHTENNGKTNSFKFKDNLDQAEKDNSDLSLPFFAYAPGRQNENLLPVFQKTTAEGLNLSTDPNGNLLFYALPAEEIPFEKFTGAWQCHMTDGIFLNREYNLKLVLQNDQLTAQLKDAGYSVKELTCSDSTLALTVQYVDMVYHFEGTLQAGKISGTWNASDGSTKGTWYATLNDHIWEPVHSPLVSGLYLYTDKKTGSRMYSIENENINNSYIRSARPVCRVWANPAGQSASDFSIRPVVAKQMK